MKPKLIIFPYNGNGMEAFDAIADQYDFIGFADDTKTKQGKHEHFEVFPREIIHQYKEAKVLAVIGSVQNYLQRKTIIDQLGLEEKRFATLIHPKATVSKLSSIGFNTLIMAGVNVTSNGIIGNHVCVLPNTVLHHDITVGDYTLIGSNVTVAGGVQIGAHCYIGSASSMISNISIGEKTLVGIGANVLKNIPAGSKAVGNPARLI